MKTLKRIELEAKLYEAERKAYELRAQLASNLGAAFDNLPKAGEYKGSVVILTLTALGGAEIIRPVAIRDGLSAASISALQDDVCSSFEVATMVNPAMARRQK